jgi:cysteine-rich repeat protein
VTAGTIPPFLRIPSGVWVARNDTTGGFDTSFGEQGDGLASMYPLGMFTSVFLASVDVAPDGKILLTGATSDDQMSPTFFVLRLAADGTLDASFGGGGVALLPRAPFERTPRFVVQPNGDILAFGRAPVAGTDPLQYDLAVARIVGSPCGDGRPDVGEACDDGVAVNGTPQSCCTEACALRSAGSPCAAGACDDRGVCVAPGPPVCGDKVVQVGEGCDDGNKADGDCCSESCVVEGATQRCAVSSNPCLEDDHCDGNAPVCRPGGPKAAGTICPGGRCDGAGACVSGRCGNGVVEGAEQCDDGNTIDGDCCSAACTIEGSSQICRLSDNPCIENDHCDGNVPVCRPGGFQPPGTTLCTDGDGCTGPGEDSCDGKGGCTPGPRVCDASFTSRKQAYRMICESQKAGSCTVSFSIPDGALRGTTAALGTRGACPAALAPGASADTLVVGSGKALALKASKGAAFTRKTTLKLSKTGARLLRCQDVQLEARVTIVQDGQRRVLTRLLPLLKQLRRRRG